MARADRYDTTLVILSADKVDDDGYGGVVKDATPSTVASAYKCSVFRPSAFSRLQLIAEYGLSEHSVLYKISGEYNASIANGQFTTIYGKTVRLIGVNVVKGTGNTPVALAILGEIVKN